MIIGPKYRDWQRECWDNRSRFNILVVHRRAGKTVHAIKWLVKRVIACDKPAPRGAYLAPLYRQAKAIAWDYLKQYTRDIAGTKFNESELRAIFRNGAEIRLLGAAEPDSLRGLYLDAVVCDEFAQFQPRAWSEVLRPAIADRQGEALIIGTVFGRANQFYEFYRDAEDKDHWYRRLLTCLDTDAIPPEEMDLMRQDMSEDEWAQEMMCDWDAAVKGSYYGKEMSALQKAGQVTHVPHDADLPVHTSWDLGMADSTIIILWQRLGTGEVRAIDCLEFQNTGLAEMVQELHARPYNWGEHILPHDAKVRELGTGRSRVEVLRGLGINPRICKNLLIQDGINATRQLLPRVWFDKDKCFMLVEALKTYRSEWNDDRRVFSKAPLHSFESHFADAVRYFAIMEKHGLTDTWGHAPDYSALNRASI